MKKKSMIICLILGIVFLNVIFYVNSQDNSTKLNDGTIKYVFNITGTNLGDGDYRIYLISTNHDNLSSSDSIKYFNDFKSKYITAKKLCGLSSDYSVVIQDGINQLNSSRKICSSYNKFVIDNIEEHTMEFNGAYLNYFVYNSTKYNYRPIYSKIQNNVFQLILNKSQINNPYFIILEKLNSADSIFITDPSDIPFVEDISTNENNLVVINVDSILTKSNNKLSINFGEVIRPNSIVENLTIPKEDNTESTNPYSLYLIIGAVIIFIVIVIVILYFKFRKIPIRSIPVESKSDSYEPAAINTD